MLPYFCASFPLSTASLQIRLSFTRMVSKQYSKNKSVKIMADKFGRHQSTRWVRASVPAYGEDWNDDDGYNYDYGYGSGATDSEEEVADHDNVVAERFVLPDEKQADQSPEKPAGDKLVLSIDKLTGEGDLNSASNTEDEGVNEGQLVPNSETGPETVHSQTQHQHQEQNGAKPSEGKVVETIIPVNQSAFEPPTPSFSDKAPTLPETPMSERSFQSDDSILHEPELNVRTKETVTEEHNAEDGGDPEGTDVEPRDDQPDREEEPENVAPVVDGAPLSQVSSEHNGENLVLSIDNRDFQLPDSSDSEREEDPVPYYERKLEHHSESEQEDKSLVDDAADTDREQDPHGNKTDALDSFISDLQNSYSSDKGGLPPIDSHVSLPDFENDYSYYDYDYDDGDDEQDSHPVTPIAPLSTADERNFHEKFVNELSGHKPSIRKPPASDQGSLAKHVIKKTEIPALADDFRQPVDSPGYNTFGDAVDAYMSDRGSVSTLNKSGAASNRGSDDETDKGEQPQTPPGELQDSSEDEGETVQASGSTGDQVSPASVDRSSQVLSPPSGESELHPVNSTGSLSTGKLSFDPRTDFEAPGSISAPGFDKELNRRDSTMSANTFNMGSWTPNTNSFRDRFINDNDNESAFNFNMNDDAGYQKFTKHRSVSDNMSFISSASIPETVDVPLPSIHEDSHADEEENDDGDDTFSSGDHTNNTSGNTNQGLAISNVSTSSDSILNEREYTDKFREEFSSEENLPVRQRYTSLLSPIPDEGSKRTVSGASTTATSTTGASTLGTAESSSIAPSVSISDQSSRTITHTRAPSSTSTSTFMKHFPSNAYPVSNWNSIMKASQPVDRIRMLKDALDKEYAYDTGLQTWLHETLTRADNSSNIHIGKLASQAYQNATHNDLRRHVSIRSRVSSVKDKVETGGLHASNLGKKFFHRSKKLMGSKP